MIKGSSGDQLKWKAFLFRARAAFGVVDAYNCKARRSPDSRSDEEELILPGMRRHLYLRRRSSGGEEEERPPQAGDAGGTGGDDDSPSLLLNKLGLSEQSSFDTATEGKKTTASKQ